MTPRDLRRLRAADRTRLRTVVEKLAPIAREAATAATAAACFADSARMTAAEHLGIADDDCDTSTPEDCHAVWSDAEVCQASRIYEALVEAQERIAHTQELIADDHPDK